MAIRNTLLIVAASAASGAVAYQAASSYQASSSEQAASASPSNDPAKSGAADPKAQGEGGSTDAATKVDEPETLVLNLQPGGFVQENSKLTFTFSVDKLVKGGDAVEGVTLEEIVVTEDGEVSSPDEGWRRFTSEFRDVRVNHRLLLDLSGSMATETQLDALARAGARYVDKVLATKDSGNQFIAIDGFDGGPVVSILGYTQDAMELKRALANPCGTTLCNDPSTNLHGALEAEITQLETEALEKTSIGDRAIVLFTDGIDQAGAADLKETLARSAASGVHVYTVAVGGSEGDQERLGAFGKAGNFPATELKDLTKAAEAVADRTPLLAKHFYRIEYCTPKRGGSHSLKLNVRHKGEQKTVLVGSLTQEFELKNDKFDCDIPRPKQ